ncbi:ATP-dependent DNA ligase [Bradyrhizobium brasilense]|uniref:ATP-dependent DNA ligase n=1 Tax=Bradyrhizobium brasilense TaxID=1419277 RepID=UPI003B969472
MNPNGTDFVACWRGTGTRCPKSGQDLARYFPEIVAAARDLREQRLVLDGELVVEIGGQFSFNDLLQCIHPAASRVQKLSRDTPALFLAFDLLELGDKKLADQPLSRRRPQLEKLAGRSFSSAPLFRLSPASTKFGDAERWLQSAGGGSDGVVAKRLDLPYQTGKREGMQKIKRYRSADCVIGGFRYGEKLQAGRKAVASLLLGLYDADGLLHHVGFSSAIKAKDKPYQTQKGCSFMVPSLTRPGRLDRLPSGTTRCSRAFTSRCSRKPIEVKN